MIAEKKTPVSVVPPLSEYQPHMLHSNYQGCMECHIQGDFL
jgi:mRNA-degrading endonuclease YafQ of YafQ-DinJ toxin-antitoxin module